MSNEDQIRTGVTCVFALSLECVLAGIVTDAPIRGWVVHALAVVTSLWALNSERNWSNHLVGLTGAAAVANEVLMLTDNGEPLRLLVPSLVLLGCSAWVLLRTFGTVEPQTPRPTAASGRVVPPVPPVRGAGRAVMREFATELGGVSEAIASVATGGNARGELRRTVSDPAWSPFLLFGGSIAIVFSMTSAKWVTVDALFGLIERSYAFHDLRDFYNDLGIKYFSRVYYFEWGYLVTYAAAGVALLVGIGEVTKRFQITGVFKQVGFLVVAFALVSHTATVMGLNDAAEELLLLSGAWVGSVGLAAAGAGLWLAGRRV